MKHLQRIVKIIGVFHAPEVLDKLLPERRTLR